MRRSPADSVQMRIATACAITPLGMNTAAGRPSSAATFCSKPSTSGPSP
jgi:hypothetical protein